LGNNVGAGHYILANDTEYTAGTMWQVSQQIE
jgi:hypothetical protein